MMRNVLLVALAATLASPSQAQTAPAPSASGHAANALGGPAIAGVCLLSRQDVLNTSMVGKAATARLRVLTEQAKAEIDADRASLEPDVQKFNAEQAKMTDAQRQERRTALAARVKPVQDKAELREREIEATRVKVTTRLAGELETLIAQVYKQRNCGLLVDRNAILGGNLANDLTGPVVSALDAKMQTIAFDRENLAAASTSGRTAGSN